MAMANGFMEIEPPLYVIEALMPLLWIFLPSCSPSQCRLAPMYPRAVVSGDGGGRASETCNFTLLLTIGTAECCSVLVLTVPLRDCKLELSSVIYIMYIVLLL